MRLYIKNRVFSWQEKFDVFDENGVSLFYAECEAKALGNSLKIFESSGIECLQIKEKVMSFTPKYCIYMNEKPVATLRRKFSLTRSKYEVKEKGWIIEGDFSNRNYTVLEGKTAIARVCEKRFTWGNTHEIDVSDDDDVKLVMAIAIIIDAAIKNRGISAAEI